MTSAVLRAVFSVLPTPHFDISRAVEKDMRVFKSSAEAEAAEDAYYAAMPPQERLNLVFEIIAQAYPEIEQGSERVCRVVKLKEAGSAL